MTQKEFFKAVANGNITDEVTTYAQTALAKLEERKKTETENQKANKALIAQMVGDMEIGRKYAASELATEYGINTQKVTALMKIAADGGMVEICDFKPTGKGRSVKGYSVIVKDEDEDTEDYEDTETEDTEDYEDEETEDED